MIFHWNFFKLRNIVFWERLATEIYLAEADQGYIKKAECRESKPKTERTSQLHDQAEFVKAVGCCQHLKWLGTLWLGEKGKIIKVVTAMGLDNFYLNKLLSTTNHLFIANSLTHNKCIYNSLGGITNNLNLGLV